MLTVRARITPLSAFGTLPKGDTLFGQLCWSARNHFGEDRLRKLLEGYTEGDPFAVVSDAFPAGHLPRPALPGHWFAALAGADRKEAKKRLWLPEERLGEPVESWLQHCRKAGDVPGGAALTRPQPHNAIDRRTGTTGEGFAPYAMTRHWYEYTDSARLDIYIVLDEARLAQDELEHLLTGIGEIGFGRDASIGLGKFRVESLGKASLSPQVGADAWLTLAPCAPQGLDLDAERSFYQVFTRFGRHGDVAVHRGNPFKTPVLLAQTAAVLVPKQYQERPFVGRGLGGDGSLSKAIPETVHQGYAPVVGIRLAARKEAVA
ncbi:MAG TPA: CRISPR-associated protein Csm7 [Candidatus Competibacteraceae bacterium]|nr:CRISPR-associated protein Csm7 [Candidatus Competibacteraceae bacterium]